MERLNRLIDLFSTTENSYVVNELLLLKKDIEIKILNAEIKQIEKIRKKWLKQ